jgi:2-keto-4-pentenoate hydratase/2-oxohepta-3-ene-1,7-dioic acid hydratase in catechol pathway
VQVEALAANQWLRLSNLPKIQQLAQDHNVPVDLHTNILSVLKLPESGWRQLAEELNALEPAGEEEGSIVQPFAPASFRDFMLYEQHVVDASRGFAKKFMPAAYKKIRFIERVTRKPFSKFKPKPIWYRQPTYYFGNHLNFSVDGDPITWPSHSSALDYELELGAILRSPIFNASSEEAEQAIGGFVVLNDWSARDLQIDEMNSGFGPQKAKHFANAMSAILVTADEVLPRIDALRGSVFINGKEIAQCSSAGMYHSLQEAIAFASTNERLYPGELFGTGTLPGGSGMENGHWLKQGDHLELNLEGIGSINSHIHSQENAQ